MEDSAAPLDSKPVPNDEASSVQQNDPGSYSDVINDILRALSSYPGLQERLKSFLASNDREIVRSREDYTKANQELGVSIDRVSKLETELNDVRSATPLLASNQDEMLSSLNRHHGEKPASSQSIFDQKIVDSGALNRTMFDQERIEWEKERNMLLSRLHSMEMAHSSPHPLHRSHRQTEVSTTTKTDQLTPLPDCNGCTQLEQSNCTEDLEASLELTQLQRYKNEIDRLHRLLEDSRLQADLGSADDDLQNSSSQHPCVSTAVQTGSPLTASEDAVPTSVTEADWLKLQSAYKSIVLTSVSGCAMCQNYEQLLQKAQTLQRQHERTIESQSAELAEKTTELSTVYERQSELEEALNTRSTAQSEQIERLESSLQALNQQLEQCVTEFRAQKQSVTQQLEQMSGQYKDLQANHMLLQSYYDTLLGRRSKAAAELSAQPISLPSDKTDLEVLALKLHEENITLREAREHLDQRLTNSSVLYEEQLGQANAKRKAQKAQFQRELDEVNARLASLNDIVHQRDKEIAARARVEAEVVTLKGQISDLQGKLSVAESQIVSERAKVSKLHQRLICLQADLDNTESVQADFVRLSQNLQMQLEKLRQQEHEVRWIDPEDAFDCFACHTVFPTGSGSAARKVNCKHCGKVHCQSCLRHTFPSGLSGRPARVCDVCHTLLNKNAAPYFSTGLHAQSSSKPSRVSSPNWRRHSTNTRSASSSLSSSSSTLD